MSTDREWISESKLIMLLAFIIIISFMSAATYNDNIRITNETEQLKELINKMDTLDIDMCPSCCRRTLEKMKSKSHSSTKDSMDNK